MALGSNLEQNESVRPASGRLREALRHWEAAAGSYHDPEDFRISVNACIQSIRNVTFSLQSNKSAITDFDEWYTPWQAALKNDRIMKWCTSARNRIVKQGDLDTHSVAATSLVIGHHQLPTKKFEVCPLHSSDKIAAEIHDRFLPEEIRQFGYLYVERKWVVKEFAHLELLEMLAYAISVLQALVSDVENRRGPSMFNFSDSDELFEDGAIPDFAQEFREYRITWLKLSTGEIVQVHFETYNPRIEDQEAAAAKYNLPELYKKMQKKGTKVNLKELLEIFLPIGKRMLEVDGYHTPMVFLIDRKRRLTMLQTEFPDHEDKTVIWAHIAKEAKRKKAIEVLVIAEVWTARFDPDNPRRRPENAPDRVEALEAVTMSNKGDEYVVVFPFRREEGKIIFEEQRVLEAVHLSFLEPFRRVWRKTIRKPKANKPMQPSA